MRCRLVLCTVWAVATIPAAVVWAQPCDQTVGLFQHDPGTFPGYTLFCPLNGKTTFLIDNDGLVVNTWTSTFDPGNSLYLLEDGTLLRTADPGGNTTFVAGGDAGLIEQYDWDGNVLWSYLYSDTQVRAHHDIAPMPNGNVLVLAWEFRSEADAIQAGRDPDNVGDAVWPEHVVEVQPDGANGGIIVWEWHAWDHLIQDFDATKDNFGVVADHPELIDINFANGDADWMHANALDYNAELDQIMINSPDFAEFWIIDHSTTTAEAAGHTGGATGMGGDILYRWGNPQAYGAGTNDDRRFWNQHDAHWNAPGTPGAGNIMVFNNGLGRPEGPFTSIEEIMPPLQKDGTYALTPGLPFGPDEPSSVYTDDPPFDFFASFISGAQRLPNGNTLICSGAFGVLFEVADDDTKVWRYVNPETSTGPLTQCDFIPGGVNSTANRMFRATRYPADYAGFDGQDLTPGGPIEMTECGNGLTEHGEDCDDANTENGDGCDENCAFEPCTTFADCADGNADGIRDHACVWWACLDGVCSGTDILFADVGGPFGDCATDGTADANDSFHVLNCFADLTVDGQPGYPCEAVIVPQALNIDPGGPFGDCAPDGVCDGNDVFHVLDAFGGSSTCSCPLDGGPAPVPPLDDTATEAMLQMVAHRVVLRPGQRISVDVHLATGLETLRGFQLHAVATGGTHGALELVDIAIEPRPARSGAVVLRERLTPARKPGFVFGDADIRSAFNLDSGQVLAVAGAEPYIAAAGSYLATFTFRASADAAGIFAIDLAHDHDDSAGRTFLFGAAGQDVIVRDAQGVRVSIEQ